MEVYHLIRDSPEMDANSKLRLILSEGLRAGEDGLIYARPYELPQVLPWVSFEVSPDVLVSNHRLQGTEEYEGSVMTLEDYFKGVSLSRDTKYVDFLQYVLDKETDYLPEVRSLGPKIDVERIIRYCDGRAIKRMSPIYLP